MSARNLSLGLLFSLLVPLGAACSPSSEDANDTTGAGAGAATVASTGTSFAQGASTGQNQGLVIDPLDPVMNVTFGTPGQSIQFTAKDATGAVVNPIWFLNTPEAGTIDPSGNFVSNGQAGGDILVTAKYADLVASTTIHIHLVATENPANLTPQDIATLEAPGGMAETGFQIVYPYDKTVFPRAIVSPQIHVNGTSAPTAYYVHFLLPGCEYKGFLPPAPQIGMTQAAWDAIGSCTDGTEATVEVSKLVNGQKVGPLTQKWRIAKGKLHGVIYYNTYDSQLVPESGAMMRINGNSATPEVLVGQCTVCHSISSDGSTAAAANHGSGIGGIFDLTSGMLNPPNIFSEREFTAFAALYPKNGEVWVTQGAPGSGNTPGTGGTWTSALYRKDGTPIPDSGIETYYAQSPVFSHDGKHLAFTDRNPSDGSSVLAVMDYDAVTQKFTNYRALATPMAGRHFSWPAFTPDNNWIVVQDGVGNDLVTWGSNTGKLRAFNLTTGVQLDLAVLNGDGYMPQGARDEDLNYEPTILPIAAGGYFWVMYTSRRTYGNVLTGTRDQTKRLWVSAFDANADGTTDPSHPGFYISGQELTSGNSRGFWALPPCQDVGNSCTSGDECCGGYCNPDPDDPSKFTCGTPDGECSAEFENCNTSADCCDPTLSCIGGKCSIIPPA